MGSGKENCIFCKIISGEVGSEVILKSEKFIVIKDVDQSIKGHALVIPKKHMGTFMELSSKDYLEFLKTTKKATQKILGELGLKSFNLLNNNYSDAGQVVDHLHLHIIPRKKGDNVNGYFRKFYNG